MFSKIQIKHVQSHLKAIDERLSILFETLGDLTRFRIFKIITHNQNVCATDLARVLKISLPAVSYHLKILELVGLVKGIRKGQMICYELQTHDPLVEKLIRVTRLNKPTLRSKGY